MKKLSVCLSIVALTLSSTSSAFALKVGTWTLDSTPAIQNGVWTESFDGGGPGLFGNKFSASDTVWQLSKFILDSPGAVADQANSGWLISHYSGGELIIIPGNPAYDGGSLDPITIAGMNAVKVNYRPLTDSIQSFTFTATGVYQEQPVSFRLEFSGDPKEISNNDGAVVKQTTKGVGPLFSAVSFTVGPAPLTAGLLKSEPMPDGGTTAGLLGLAMFGLFGLRRKALSEDSAGS